MARGPRIRSIRKKLTWVVMLASSVALLSAATAFLGYDVFSFRQEMVDRFSKDAEILGFNSVAALLFEDQEAATKTLKGLEAEPDVIRAAIYDRAGRLFASYARRDTADAARLPQFAAPAGDRFGDDALLLTRAIRFEGKPVGSVFIETSLAEMGRRVRSYARIVLLVCLASFLVALAISSHFQKAISRPILDLAETARIVSTNKDYAIRASHGGDDELGLLVRTFNEMLSQIEQQDAALRESQERFDRAVRGTTDGLWDWDIDAGKVWYSPTFKALLEYDESGFPGSLETLTSHLHPEDRAATLEALRLHLDENRPFDVEFRLRTRGGDFRWFRARAVAMRSADARPVRMAGSIQDVTERRRTQEALAQSERYFRELANAMPQIVWAARPNGQADYYNKRWFEYTGLSLADSTVRGWHAVLHPDDLEPSLERWKRASESGEDFTMEYRFRRHADGVYRWHLGRAVPVRDEHGRIVRWFGTCTDIDDQKQTAEVLAHQAQDLERSNDELKQFAYVASHDLQEPLRGVTGCVQLLQRRYAGTLDERADELIRHAVEAATRMETLITDLLSYSRVGTRGNSFTPMDCGAILKQTLDNLRVSIEESGAQVTSDELPTVIADATQLTQLLQNLIGNAIKFRDEKPPRVHVGVVRQGADWLFSVRDNGIGIDASYFERIFGVFQRLHTRTRYPGTGIGLAICKKIVERHGGTIRVESEPGRGSTFYFSIPVQEVSTHEDDFRLQAH